MLLTIVVGAVAQVTTSSMAGKVTLEGSGEEIIGATVVAVHEPSGTRYTAVTNMNGMFTIQGMRPGGPYRELYRSSDEDCAQHSAAAG